jgi:Amt family ammonium transporter
MLVSTALVVLMTIPGLALFYSGLVKKENVLNTLFLSFAAYAVVSVIWFIYGYDLVFGMDAHGFLGLPSNPFFHGLLESQALHGTIPLGLYAVFQMTFAAITVALISGALVERIRFGAWMLFIPIWLTLVYLPIAHWVWEGHDARRSIRCHCWTSSDYACGSFRQRCWCYGYRVGCVSCFVRRNLVRQTAARL